MAALIPTVVDMETWWSTTHSLTKMSPIAYVMHADTEIQSCAIKIGDAESEVYFGEDNIAAALDEIDWSRTLVIAHNMEGFDSMILAWRFGIRPQMYGCTLAMARPHHTKTVGLSLAKLVAHYELGVKDNTALINTRGRRLAQFSDDEKEAMRIYNKADTDQCAALFKILLKLTPKDEMRIIDRTIRMLVEPQFVLDRPLIASTLAEEIERKRSMVLDVATMSGAYHAGMNEDEALEAARVVLASAAKFAKFLTDCGVEVPMKPSPSNPDKETYALAKTDQAFLDLKEHPDEMVSLATLARLGVKSTLLETRLGAFIAASDAVGGRLPMPTKYYGADTTGRRSGWAYNPLNLPRVDPKKPKLSDALRNSLKAPKGYKVIVADLSGIELRMNHFLWQVPSSMALFQADPEKADLYKEFACDLYEIKREAVDKNQRQMGKIAHLGLGFGAGAATFKKVAKSMGGVDISLEDAQGVVEKWRAAFPEITRGWRTCHDSLKAIAAGIEQPIDPWELCWTCEEGIRTPKGLIRYQGLHQELAGKKNEWWYGTGRHRARIYAGKIDENIVQHLSRFVITDADLAFSKTPLGKQCKLALEVYDELVYLAPEDQAEEALAVLQDIMRTPPAWFPQLVTWSAGDCADTYGEAK